MFSKEGVNSGSRFVAALKRLKLFRLEKERDKIILIIASCGNSIQLLFPALISLWERKISNCNIASPVELLYISCKNLAELVHIRHYLQKSCNYLKFQTNLTYQTFLADSDVSNKIPSKNLARQCLKNATRNSARKCLECTENVQIVFSILNQEYVQKECKGLVYGVPRT